MYSALASIVDVNVERDWLDTATAVATVLSVLLALALALSAVVTGRRRNVRQQAEQVSAWVVADPFEVGLLTLQGTGYVRNDSSQPLHGVVVYPRQHGIEARQYGADPIFVAPGEFKTFPAGLDEGHVSQPLRVDFTDNAGRHWSRRTDGRLRRRHYRWWNHWLDDVQERRWERQERAAEHRRRSSEPS